MGYFDALTVHVYKYTYNITIVLYAEAPGWHFRSSIFCHRTLIGVWCLYVYISKLRSKNFRQFCTRRLFINRCILTPSSRACIAREGVRSACTSARVCLPDNIMSTRFSAQGRACTKDNLAIDVSLSLPSLFFVSFFCFIFAMTDTVESCVQRYFERYTYRAA